MISSLLLLLVCSAVAVQYELNPNYNPVADPKAVVISGDARFTVLTDRLIRVEYSKTASFEDRASLAVVNRRLSVPSFTSATSGNVLTIKTKSLFLQYSVGQQFARATLNVTVTDANVPVWRYGDADWGNLLGTIKSLDELGVTPLNCTLNANIRVHDESLHCEWGLISRNGWAVYNDQDNEMLDPQSQWWQSPNTDDVDLYFFGHASDYMGALSDYVQIGGNLAMPPRAALGVMWSRWYNVDAPDVLEVVADYENRGIPLDNYIADMDWHTKEGWGGYTFDPWLFPVPEAIWRPLRARGLLTSGNLHDLDGMRPNEAQYAEFCKAIGVNPNSNQTIAFAIANQTYALALEDIVLKALEDKGFGDFWWIDWQQGGKQGGCRGGKMNPTIWLNRLRGTDKIRRGQSQRGMVLARWGGLGNHRYQVGFSGDVADVTWPNLAYQPYFSYTASNVLYGFWSHDIVGQFGPNYDYELYTRWVQWGSFSGVMRSHDRGMASGDCAQTQPYSCGIIKVWDVPTPYFEANRAALQERHRLLPYLYNAQREAFDTGVSLLRPMYYYFPDEANAYLGDQNGNYPQYFLGPDIIVSPIVNKGSSSDTLARQNIWVPPGVWIEELSGAVWSAGKGGVMVSRAYDLTEVPRFIAAGSIIPKIPLRLGRTIGRALQQYDELDISIYLAPGVNAGSTTLYEDDAVSVQYFTKNAYTNTRIAFQRDNRVMNISVDAPQGSYPEFPSSRRYTFRFVASPPSSVVINPAGTRVTYSSTGGPNTWRYDGRTMQVVIETGDLDTASAFSVSVVATDSSIDGALFGIQGKIARARLAKLTLDPSWSTPADRVVQPGHLSLAATSDVTFSYFAGVDFDNFTKLVLAFGNIYSTALQEMDQIKPSGAMNTRDTQPPPTKAQWVRAMALLNN